MTTAIKPTKITFKKVESEWYNYHHTLKEINRLREEIMSPFDEEQEDINIVKGANSVRDPGDPTGRIATRLTTNKQLAYLNTVVEAINQVYNALPDDYKKLVHSRYWSKDKRSWDHIAHNLNVSRRQAFYWRKEIIQATIELLGWR